MFQTVTYYVYFNILIFKFKKNLLFFKGKHVWMINEYLISNKHEKTQTRIPKFYFVGKQIYKQIPSPSLHPTY